ncbi:probable 28S ribosomal protein S6, mitochondrial, partial [Diaphorina citri]|uniref:Probable 28S ribosomal protein S6, mitochondrial n=1 Tax=Diaphorina citri TaxID=121845 RepID=A0A1S3DD03_DIACI
IFKYICIYFSFTGEQATPFKISNHGQVHKKANYFIIEFDSSTRSLNSLFDSMSRDIDIVRNSIYGKQSTVDETECKLNDEIQPPMYRKEVQEMIQVAKDKEAWRLSLRRVYKQNTGLDYYPFQR